MSPLEPAVPPADATAPALGALDSSLRPDGPIRQFFYKLEVPYGLALMRITLPIACLVAMGYRWPFSRELFSSDGAVISMGCCSGAPGLTPALPGSLTVALHSVVLLALVASSLGWCTRVSLIVATGGYVYINLLDILGTLNKSSAIAAQLMLFLCFSQCGSVWSIDSWLARRRLGGGNQPVGPPARFPALPRRMMQILMGVVYLSTAVTKIQTRPFFSGEHLQTWMITTYHTPNLLGNHLAMQPALVIIGAYATFVWELTFVFLVWRRGWRPFVLSVGVLFHLLTCVSLALFLFPWICIASYCAFLEESDFNRARDMFARWREQGAGFRARVGRLLRPRVLMAPNVSPAWSYGILGSLALLTAVGGAGLEYRLDPYGMRRPEGPYRLKKLDPDLVAEMLGPTQRIRHEDTVFMFDVGSIVVGGAVLDHKTQFRPGDTVWIQCGLLPPHESLWLECNLHDAENRVVDARETIADYSSMRTLFNYRIGRDILPGEYSVVLKIGGEEIMRRQIRILGGPRGAAAN